LFNGILISLGTTKLNSNNPLTTVAFPLKIVSPMVKFIAGLLLSLLKVVRAMFLSNIAVAISPL
jgi:hypothetical protein